MNELRFLSSVRRLALAVTVIAFGLPGFAVRAEDIPVTTRIDAVTVFPTGAEITRAFDVKLQPGEHRILVRLPNTIQTDSIQIKSDPDSGVSISALDLKPAPIDPTEAEAQKAETDARIATLVVEVDRQQKAKANSAFALLLVKTLAERKLQPTGAASTPPVPDPQALALLLDMVDSRLSQISEAMLDAQLKIDAAQAQIADLRKKQAEIPVVPPPEWLAVVHILAKKGGTVSFRLGYRLAAATWAPLYEARLSTETGGDSARIELVRTAIVAQNTSDDWTDVELTLSTAQRTSSVSVPGLRPLGIRDFISEAEQEQSQSSAANAKAGNAGSATAAPALASNLGFNVLYAIPGRVSVERTGTRKTVRIGTGEGAADLFLSAVPKLDLTAYLGAHFLANTDTPMLPGRVMLFRDGVFVGEDRMPLTAPGETITLGFGADDLVSIERRQVARKSGETGLVSTAHVEERSHLTTVVSSHSFGIPITIKDQVPVSDDERIRVDLLQETPAPDDDKTGARTGVYSWTRQLNPGKPEEFLFGFRVTWPKGITR